MWTVIACTAIIMTIAMGLRSGFGLFVKPISVEFNVGRELFSFAVAVQNLLWGAASPFFGGLADRYGAAKIGVIGAALYVAGLIVLGSTGGSYDIVLGNVLIGAALAAGGQGTLIGAVGRMVPAEKRSMALGILMAGGSVGQFVMVPYTQVLIDALGWSRAFFALAATSALMLPMLWIVRDVPTAPQTTGAQTLGEALREAFAHRGFWLLTAGFFVCGFHVVFVATHLPAYLSDQGLPANLAAWTLALTGLFNIIGSYSAGVLGGRYVKKNLLSLLYLARSAVFLLFILAPKTEVTVLLFGAALGLLWLSTVPLTSGLVATLFGPAYMSMLFGFVFFSHQVGSFLGAWLGGKVYDLVGNYDAMWWISVALGIASALLHWPIREQPVPRLAPAAATR
ncbi:MAG: MFS transporter [Alphaproteobacteria bacterium]|nr:MFS transporter [Alphaproteobacteria bacterium]